MYSIGQLSKKTGVTVRTLDYYDEIELIKPSSKTSGGHRQYDEKDVMRLQQILALKYMGFSLERIKNILKDLSSTWEQSIAEQLEMVRQEQERLKMLEQALLGVLYSIEFEGEMNWSIVFSTIQLFQKGPEDAFQQYKDHLNDEDIQKIMELNNNMTPEDIQEWMESISDIKNNLDLDPGSKKARELVERWHNQVKAMFGDDEELIGGMWESMQNKEEGIAFYPMDKDFIDFIQRVYMAHHGE